jgi:hypothetical protein
VLDGIEPFDDLLANQTVYSITDPALGTGCVRVPIAAPGRQTITATIRFS